MKHLLTAILLLAFAHTAAGERNVSLERDFGTLYGTLLTPDAGTETVAVIIAGSGPTPRNGNVNSYLYLAQALEKAGIASLRYDKRGIGASRFTEPEKMADAVLGDFIGDAAAWADYLAGEGFRRVVLIGHSEGALIAFCAAQQTPKVAAVVSLAGAGYPLDEILQLQLASQLLPDNMDLLLQANANPARRSSKRCSTLRYRRSGSPACATTRARRSARCGFRYSSWAGTTTCRCHQTMPRRWQRHSPGPGRQSSQG